MSEIHYTLISALIFMGRFWPGSSYGISASVNEMGVRFSYAQQLLLLAALLAQSCTLKTPGWNLHKVALWKKSGCFLAQSCTLKTLILFHEKNGKKEKKNGYFMPFSAQTGIKWQYLSFPDRNLQESEEKNLEKNRKSGQKGL